MIEDTERPFALMTVADVFCGAGGLSEGFRQAENANGDAAFEVVFGVDRDPDCVATFKTNVLTTNDASREGRAVCRSIVGLTGTDVLEAAGVDAIDVLVGGPNCQAVSSAGRRNLDDERNAMFKEYARLVEELQPRWFLMENVPGLTHANGLPLLGEILERFGELDGYEVAGDVLLAAEFGVPQYRYRLFLVGTRTDLPIRLPVATHFPDKRPGYRTVLDAIGRGSQRRTELQVADENLDMNVRRIKHVPAGGDWRDIPVELLPDRSFAVRTSDQKGAYGRLSWTSPAFTITGLANNVTAGPFTHPDEDRVLNVQEAAALQGFRSNFRFFGSMRSQYRQIGNAVPPGVAKALAEAIVGIEAGRAETLARPRLTEDVVQAAIARTKRLPVMTPRVAKRSSTKPTAARARTERATQAPSGMKESRPPVGPGARARLHAEAALPKYSWTAKRAKAILGVLDGQDVDSLASDLKISTVAARRWYDEFMTSGVEGWRAYHTPVDLLAAGDEAAAARIKAAIDQVRRPTLVAEVREGRARTHMNRHLRRLIRRFEGESVNTIMARLAAIGRPAGTIYVGDLLTVADVLLDAKEDERSTDGGAAAGAR